MSSVLVVDDDQELLEMVSIALSSFDFSVHTLSDCEQFFSILPDIQPDVILMDIYLGPCDGRELCRKLKTGATYSSLPVLLYSAGRIPPDSVTESLADGFMAKPFNINALFDHLLKLIKNK